MNLDEFTKQTRMESEKPSGWAYDFEGMKTYEKERMKSAEEFSMGILDEERKVTEEGLKTDKLFLDATNIAYKQMYGKMLEGSEEEIASQGMQLVSDALIPNMTAGVPFTDIEGGAGLLGIYKHFKDAHPEAKQAMYYMIDTINKKDTTLDGFIRGVKSLGKDPTTYTGIGLTYSFFAKSAAKNTAKKELMKMLGEASVVGGAYMGTEEALMQDLQGKQDLGEIATQTGIGAVAAPVMVGGVKALGVGGKKALTGVADFMQNTEQEMMKMAGGGTPPQEFKVPSEKVLEIDKTIEDDIVKKELEKQAHSGNYSKIKNLPIETRQEKVNSIFSRTYKGGDDVDKAPLGLMSNQYPENVNYRGFEYSMTPSDFLSLASERKNDTTKRRKDFAFDIAKNIATSNDMKIAPMKLYGNIKDGKIAIEGHEGRHRADAIQELFGKDVKVPVDFELRKNDGEMRRRSYSGDELEYNVVSQDGKEMGYKLKDMLSMMGISYEIAKDNNE